MDYAQIEAKAGDKKLLVASQGGKLAWSDIIGRLKEFDYEKDGLAVKWHMADQGSKVLIDPHVQFGAPAIKGIATWVFKGRWESGEELDDIAEDFGLNSVDIIEALDFEGIDTQMGRGLRH